MTAFTHLTLTDFRSYQRAELPLDGRPVFLVGPNGAGKTNLLEAVSLFTPGRGLRNATGAELGRRMPGETQGRAWAVAAVIEEGGEPTRIGTGIESAGAAILLRQMMGRRMDVAAFFVAFSIAQRADRVKPQSAHRQGERSRTRGSDLNGLLPLWYTEQHTGRLAANVVRRFRLVPSCVAA